ncbi:MAG: GNAT family N-acetyltransferase [Eubacteriales bacterium]|nr:GNAT family N-acetyltransferase [Eubacteriales bacterium]
MEFKIRKANRKDLTGIMEVMEEAAGNLQHPDWFVADEETAVKEHLEKDGFGMAAEASDGRIVGFFLVKYPKPEENLGVYLDYPPEKLGKVALMDSCAVRQAYRGYGLQGRLLQGAEEYLDTEKYTYLMCTVHPDNRFSLSNMQKNGYMIQATVQCYGGLLRHILVKDFRNQKKGR